MIRHCTSFLFLGDFLLLPGECKDKYITRDAKCTYSYNITLWPFRLTTGAMEEQQCVPCVQLTDTSLSTIWKYWMLHNNTSMVSKTYLCLRAKYSIFLSQAKWISIFSTDFQKMSQYQISRKPSSRKRADTYGQTDIKLIGVFHDCTNAPKTWLLYFIESFQ